LQFDGTDVTAASRVGNVRVIGGTSLAALVSGERIAVSIGAGGNVEGGTAFEEGVGERGTAVVG
jgi:hypothetical protein